MAAENLSAIKELSADERHAVGLPSDSARRTGPKWHLLTEQRLLSCEAAFLAARADAIPIQLNLRSGEIYGKLKQLREALDSQSKKSAALFQEVSLSLAALLPQPLLASLNEGSSPVSFMSDLPFEWAALDNWPLCLTRPVSRIPLGLSNWDTVAAASEARHIVDLDDPARVLVLDLISDHDRIRGYSDLFRSVSSSLGQRYTYVKANTPSEVREALNKVNPTIVVLDSHGAYDSKTDELFIDLRGRPFKTTEIFRAERVPPVWILSACDTSITGAMQGCFVRELLTRGALAVVATLSRIDAFAASVFVGRLLTDVFSPPTPGMYETFDRAFFAAQYTTALLYDPLWPLMRAAESDPQLGMRLGQLMLEFFGWSHARPIDVKKYRHEIAEFLWGAMGRAGLQSFQTNALTAGKIRPETLLFSVFGMPSAVGLMRRSLQSVSAG